MLAVPSVPKIKKNVGTALTRTISDTSIGIAVVLALALIIGAYFLGAHQAATAGPRFVPAQPARAGFMFDNKTAQICWAGADKDNPTLSKLSSETKKPDPFSPEAALSAFIPEPGIPTCKSLL
jgi:hypothetical protein